MDNRPVVIVFNGLPATGKTTLARALSGRLKYSVIGKDDIKEFLYDHFGVREIEWSRELGRIALGWLYVLIDRFLARGEPIIVEANFEREFAHERFSALIDKYRARFVEVYCYTEKEVRRQRYWERDQSSERHVGHKHGAYYLQPEEPEPLDRYGALALGELVEVDTTKSSESILDEIVQRIRS